MSKKRIKKDRLYGFTWVMVGFFGLAAFSQAKLQIFDRNAMMDKARASKKFILSHTERAKRGSIISSDGRPLAVDQDSYELTVNFYKVPKTDAFFVDLGAASGIPASEFSQLALNGIDNRTWKTPLTAAQRKAVAKVKSTWRADGLSLMSAGKRTYPLGSAAANIVGMLQDDTLPIVGLEKSQNNLLHGEDGKTIGMTDRAGVFLPMKISDQSTKKEDGDDITLTIDSELQQEAAAQIRKAVLDFDADGGVVCVQDPTNGDILALANYPTFDPTGGQAGIQTDIRKSTKNFGVQSRWEPGSMFKVMTLAKGLDMGKVHLTDHINCGGELHYNSNYRIRCDSHHGNRAHGTVDPLRAIEKSCNVSAASWSLKIGYPDMVKYLEDLGLLKPTELGVPYEAAGGFNYHEYAKPLQLMHLGFGQSLTTTPVAITSALSMIGNHGEQMKPRLIKQIGNKPIPPVSMGKRIGSEAADETLKIMESVIQSDEGTGFKMRIPGYVMGGKTGTAEKQGKGKQYVSNFVGFVPSPNPKAVIVVMIDNPKKAYYGATVAGPVFKAVAQTLIHRYHIQPNEGIARSEQTPVRR